MKNHRDYTIQIEGVIYDASHFHSDAGIPSFTQKSDFHKKLYHFLLEWYDESPSLEVQTSGSTGKPQKMSIEKHRMLNSAMISCQFLELKPDDTALLCMPLAYIAGKMMVVRAIYANLNLYISQPSSTPLAEMNSKINFSAMTPMQVHSSLGEHKEKLTQLDKLIIGGGAINPKLEAELRDFSNIIYSTYGMTETLSHIALRRINGNNYSEYYTAFDSVKISTASDSSLIINAPLLTNEVIHTNDIVEIKGDREFKVLGRTDNIINSGAVKLQIEEIEKEISKYLSQDFAISALLDEKFGEVVVLVLTKDLQDKAFLEKIDKYHRPKRIIYLNEIPLTETGKTARQKLKELIASKANQ